MKTPNLFIVGAPKCGTTAIADYLSAHPEIYIGHIKEPNYWSFDMPSYSKREGLRSKEDYLALYKKRPSNTKYAIDASTHYLYSRVAIPNIICEFPDARFIVCLRKQDELSEAWHMQMYNAGYDDIQNFEEAWFAIKERRLGNNIPQKCIEPKLLDYKAIASLGVQIEKLITLVPRERFHIILLSDIKSDATSVYRKCLDFLELGYDGRKTFKPSNPAFVNRSNSLSRLIRQPVFRRYMNTFFNAAGSRATYFIKYNIKQGLYKPTARKQLRPEFKILLRKSFEEDDQLLKSQIGISLLGD